MRSYVDVIECSIGAHMRDLAASYDSGIDDGTAPALYIPPKSIFAALYLFCPTHPPRPHVIHLMSTYTQNANNFSTLGTISFHFCMQVITWYVRV